MDPTTLGWWAIGISTVAALVSSAGTGYTLYKYYQWKRSISSE